jgi:hypothetical protein
MPLPEDMQVVPVILLKRDVERIDAIVNARLHQGRRSRSEFLRDLIVEGLAAFSLPAGFSKETPELIEKQSA